MRWRVAEAKSRFSELLRAAGDEPQLIMNRDKVVAAVVAASTFEAYESWSAREHRGTLAAAFDELREICADEDYVLDPGVREDRRNAFVDENVDSAL